MKPKLSFEKILLIGTALIAVMMSASGFMVYQNGRHTTDGVRLIRHSYEVINDVEGVLATLVDAETGQRGFLLSGREIFLEPWQQAQVTLPHRLERLRDAINGDADPDPDQAARLQRFERSATSCMGLLARGVRLHRAGSRQPFELDAAKRQMDDLRAQTLALTEREQKRLDERANVAESTFRATAATLVVVIAAMVGVLALLSAMSWRFARLSRRSESELLALATRDELTGLANRREFNRRLAEEVVRYERFPTPFCLVLLDIDHFKHVNDTYGHPGGDMVLRQIAAEILDTVRKIDLAARYGGEEMALILPGLTREQAFLVTDRIRLKIAARPFESDVGGAAAARFNVTLSAGVAVCDGRPRTVDALIESADKALYAAKHGGRNRTMVAEF